MTTTARQMTSHPDAGTAGLAELTVAGLLDDFELCQLCELPAAELYERTTAVTVGEWDCNEPVRVCAFCVDANDLGFVTD